MRKVRLIAFDLIGVPIVLGWLFVRYPEIFDAIIPWVAFGWLWHVTWELFLDSNRVRLWMASALRKWGGMTWIVAVLVGVVVSLCYMYAIRRGLSALAEEHRKITHSSGSPGVPPPAGSKAVVIPKSDAANPLPIDIRYQPKAYPDGTMGSGLVWNSNMVDLRIRLTNPTERDYENLDLTIATDLLMGSVVQTSGISKVELAPQARPPKKLTAIYMSMTGADGKPIHLTPTGPGISYADEYRLRCDKFARDSTIGLAFQIVKGPDSPRTIPDRVSIKGTYRVDGSEYHVDQKKSFNTPKNGGNGIAVSDLSNAQVLDGAHDLTRRLRQLDEEQRKKSNSISNRFIKQGMGSDKNAMQEAMTEMSKQENDLATETESRFGPLRAECRNMVNMLQNRVPQPQPLPNDIVKVALFGNLAGPDPIGQVADYIDQLANLLPVHR